MANLAVNWYAEAQNCYNECISAQVAFVDAFHERYVEDKVLEFYEQYKGIPTVTDIVMDIHTFNSEKIEEGFNVELAYNPEFSKFREQLKQNSEEAQAQYQDLVTGLLDSTGIFEMYDLVIKILNMHNKEYEMFDADDFQYSGEVWSCDIYGAGSKIVINDCQNHLLDKYCFGLPEEIAHCLQDSQKKRLRVICEPSIENFIRLEAAK